MRLGGRALLSLFCRSTIGICRALILGCGTTKVIAFSLRSDTWTRKVLRDLTLEWGFRLVSFDTVNILNHNDGLDLRFDKLKAYRTKRDLKVCHDLQPTLGKERHLEAMVALLLERLERFQDS